MKSKIAPVATLAAGIFCVFAMWFFWLSAVPEFFGTKEKETLTPGTFGDMFGALNTLFTGLALVGVGATIWMQRDQLRRQQEEHKASESARKLELEMAREQLTMAKEEFKRERERADRQAARESREAEPVFLFTRVNIRTWKLHNIGGAVTHLKVSFAGKSAPVEPDHYLGHQNHALVEIDAQGDFLLHIEYVRVRNWERGSQVFQSSGLSETRGKIRRIDHHAVQ